MQRIRQQRQVNLIHLKLDPITGDSPEDLGQQEHATCKGTVLKPNSQNLDYLRNVILSGRHCLHELPEAAPALADDFPGDDVEGTLPQRGRLRGA